MRVDRRLLAVLLGFSVLINLFMGGVLAGVLVTPRGTVGAAGAWAPPRQLRRLAPDERARFRQAMAPYRTQLRATRQAVRSARAQVEADIAAPTYDRSKVAADFNTLLHATAAQQALTHAALADAMGRLTPESRRMLLAGVGRVGNAANPR